MASINGTQNTVWLLLLLPLNFYVVGSKYSFNAFFASCLLLFIVVNFISWIYNVTSKRFVRSLVDDVLFLCTFALYICMLVIYSKGKRCHCYTRFIPSIVMFYACKCKWCCANPRVTTIRHIATSFPQNISNTTYMVFVTKNIPYMYVI